MRKLWEKIGNLMAAAAFAEEGEQEAALQMLKEDGLDVPADREKPASQSPGLYPPHAAKPSRA